jgi:sacsin
MDLDFGDDFGYDTPHQQSASAPSPPLFLTPLVLYSQKVDLTVRIREILSHYPPGISVLKEFVQNADDAGARVLRMCVDKRQHSTKTLPSNTLAPFQGPCLLVFNDAVCSDRDFESICNIGNSVKKLEVAKTGRFGLGFNAVYHLTDLPSFASRNRIVFFDPHAQ